jgi:hypothetical protein
VQHLLLGNTTQTANGVTTRPGPSLDLNFAASLTCIDQVSGRDLVSFTRTTSGTYFDSAGVLRSAAVNLLLRSEEFENSGIWGVLNVTVSANTQVAPTGVTSADTITDVNGVTSANVGCFQSITLANSTIYAMSCYVKAGTKTTCRVGIRDKTGTNIFANFNLATGSTTVGNALSSAIQDAGNGWYRCTTICASLTGATSQRGLVYMDTGSYTANGTGTIYVWGAQLETGSVATAYIPTTSTVNSAPRFDHNPITLESLGLLVEEQRTNSVTNNTMVGAVAGTPGTLPTSWGNFTSPTGLTRTIVASGTVNGINYIDVRFNGTPSSTGEITLYLSPITTATLAQAWTSTAWLSIAGGSTSNIATISFRNLELNSGLYVRETGVNFVSSISSDLVRSQNVTTSFGSGANQIQFVLTIFAAAGGTPIDVTIRIGLPQLELGAFPSSVIPTTTATFTRNADVANITGSAFSAWYNASEGTWFSAFSIPTSSTTGGARVYSISNSGATTQTWLRLQGGTNRVYEVTDSSTQQAVLSAGTFSAGVRYRGAVALKSNDFGFSENGSTPTVDNSGTLGTVDRMGIGMDASGTAPLNGHISRLTYYPVRIPNALLQAITL